MPFVETALIGDDSSEGILHYGAIRIRLNGSGFLQLKFVGLDDAQTQDLTQVVINQPGKEPTRLANFKGQRARLKLYTNAIDEKMIINRVIIFVKELYTSYPQ